MKLQFAGVGLAAAALVVAIGGCSSSKPQQEGRAGSTSQAIQNGSPDGTAHPFVVGVCAGNSAGNCFGICSGTLVLPNMVLTARHCVEQVADQIQCGSTKFQGLRGSAANYFVTTNNQMLGTTKGYHTVSKIIRPTPTDVCGNDIAILILTNTIPDTEAVPAIPSIKYDLTDKTHISHTAGFTAIGYGITAVGANDSGLRRIKNNVDMVCLRGDPGRSCKDVGSNIFDDKEFVGGDGTCSGDSGSGSFNQKSFDAGEFWTQGVLSRGGEQGTQCLGSIYTRLDSWRDMIVSAANDASAGWTKYPKPNPDWTVYVPAPGKDAGAPKSDAGSASSCSTQGYKTIGTTCADSCECSADIANAKCTPVTDGAEATCTRDCSADTDCGDGNVCTNALCAPKPAAAAPKSSSSGGDGGGGCSTSPRAADPTKPVPWRAAGALAVIGLALAARRRRSRG